MRLTVNRIALLAACGILTGILAVLSVLYFQGRNAPMPANVPVTSPKKASLPPPRKLTEEEKGKLRLEREAARTGQSTSDLQSVPARPEAQIFQEAERAAAAAPEKAMSDLTHKKRQLEKIPEKNVEKINEFLSEKVIGETNRETQVRQEVPIEQFDADSAQIDDCERVPNPDGSWRYVATLVDAKGNSVKVELGETEGAQTWRTMKMVKSNPLMEAIYRGSVMPLLDRKAAKKKPERQPPETAQPESPNAPKPDAVPKTSEKNQPAPEMPSPQH